MTRCIGTIGRWLAVGICLASVTAWAQEEASSRPSAKHAAEVAQQRFTKRQFERLTTKMIEVADLLEKSEPQTAKVLREAVSQAQRAFIAEDMEKVAQYLSRGLATAAASAQVEVIDELKKVLQTLRLGILDLDERLERIKKWREFLGKIDKILEKQRPLERQSNLASKAGDFKGRMDDLAGKLAEIVAEQKRLKGETAKLPDADPGVREVLGLREEVRKAIAKQTALRAAAQTAPIDKLPVTGQLQRDLGDTTEKLSDRIAAASQKPALARATGGERGGKPIAAAAKATQQAAGEMTKAADALGKSDAAKAADPQDQALADLRRAEKALDDALAKMASGSGARPLAQRQGKLAEKTGELAREAENLAGEAGVGGESSTPPSPSPDGQKPTGNLDKASEHMKKASGELGGQDRDKALDQQDKALAELEARKYRIAELKRRMMEKARQPTKPQAEEQSDLADQTGKLDKQMQDEEKTPGQKSVASASKSMSGAAKKLNKGNCGAANQDQKKAIEDLEKARSELSEAVEQEEELAQAEQLAKIDQMLQKVLDRQVKISSATKDVHAKRAEKAPHYQRGEQLKLSEMSDGEGRLADDVKRVRDMLLKEGRTVVFPEVLKEVRGDLQDTQGLLSKREAGAVTQDVQAEIEQSLREMIDAIRKELAERRRMRQGGGGGGGCCGGNQPLVPPIAELKLLRTLQLSVNRRTVSLNKRKTAKEISDADATKQHKKLGQRQEAVRKMTVELKAKMTRPAPGGGR